MAKGEDTLESDIDIVVIGIKKYINMQDYVRKLRRDVTIHSFSWAEWKEQKKLNTAFYSDVITTGIPLYGELPLVN